MLNIVLAYSKKNKSQTTPTQRAGWSLCEREQPPMVRAGMADSWVGSFGGVGDWGSKMYEDAKVA